MEPRNRQPKRRRAWWLAIGTFLILAVALAVGISSRKRSRFDFLYALGPQVAQFKPKPMGVSRSSGRYSPKASFYTLSVSPGATIIAVTTTSGTGPKSMTAMVFPRRDVAKVSELLSQRFGKRGTVYGPPQNSYSFYASGQQSIGFGTGTVADSLATQAGLKSEPGGCVVTIGEPVDLFTAKINSVLHFLRLL